MQYPEQQPPQPNESSDDQAESPRPYINYGPLLPFGEEAAPSDSPEPPTTVAEPEPTTQPASHDTRQATGQPAKRPHTEQPRRAPTTTAAKRARPTEQPQPPVTEPRRISRRGLLLGSLGVALAGGSYAAGRSNVLGKLYEDISDEPEALVPDDYEITIPWLPQSVGQWHDLIVMHARNYKISPELVAIIMTLESNGNPKAQSNVPARGLMQLTDPTASDIATKYLLQPRQQYDIWDPATNIEFGTAYLSYLRKEFAEPDQAPRWDSTVEYVAAGYNGGPGAAGDLYNGRGLQSTETLIYSRNAMNMWRERHAASSPTYTRWSAP